MVHQLTLNNTETSLIYSGSFSPAEIADLIKSKVKAVKIHLVSDTNVFSIYANLLIRELKRYFTVSHTVIMAGESSKNMDNVREILSDMFNNDLSRTDAVVYLGGGVMGDLVSFCGSIFLRGIKVVGLPTSLLAMCDSSIGGKCGVNSDYGKNTVGCIYQPTLVIANTDYLDTLPPKYFSDGMAEVIKYGYIYDAEFLERIMAGTTVEDMVNTSIAIKVRTVNADSKDTGERMKLNFGHTIAHCLERLGNYTEYGHGEAVAIGMDFALFLSGIDERQRYLYRDLVTKYHLPYCSHYNCEEIMQYIFHDKKMLDNALHFIILSKIGSAEIITVDAITLTEALKEWL